VLNLNSVMVGLQYLFLEPNPDDPLNKGFYFDSLFSVLIYINFFRGSFGDEQKQGRFLKQCQIFDERAQYERSPV